jgi:STE24 endopeptidase
MRARSLLVLLCLAAPPGAVTAQTELDPDAATAAYLERLSPEERARSDSYYEGGYWMQLLGLVYGLAVAWFLLASGLSRKLREFAAGRQRRPVLRTAVYAAGYVVATAVLTFPLSFYDGFVREHRYGLSNQTFGPWLKDRGMALGVAVVVFVPLLAVLYSVLRRAPRTWWLWGAATTVVAVNVVVLAAPVYIMPLFNEYRALSHRELREDILRMARANGVPADEVYQFDASRQSKRISANVSGLFGTMRISLNDNLLERCTPEEVRAVMGHEIGHYALNHAYEGMVFFSVVLVAAFGFLRWSFERTKERFGKRFGIQGVEDEAGLPMLVALLSLVFFAASPLTNSYTRMNEAEADIFGLNASGEADGFAEVALKLGEYRKLAPGPVEEWIFFDHPSGRARIHMAMRWKAENER